MGRRKGSTARDTDTDTDTDRDTDTDTSSNQRQRTSAGSSSTSSNSTSSGSSKGSHAGSSNSSNNSSSSSKGRTRDGGDSAGSSSKGRPRETADNSGSGSGGGGKGSGGGAHSRTTGGERGDRGGRGGRGGAYGQGDNTLHVYKERWTVQYSMGWSVFHMCLVYWYASPFLLCPGGDDAAAVCWNIESWVQLTWILQLFYYTLSMVGHWVPEIQRQLTIAMTMMVHGVVWLNLAWAIGSNTPNAMAARTDGHARSFAYVGTFTAMVLPLPLFYTHTWMKRTFLQMVWQDVTMGLPKISNTQRPLFTLLKSAAYQLFSPVLAMGLWHLILKPRTLPTDWPEWTALNSIVVVTYMPFMNAVFLFLLWALPVTRLATSPYWIEYYRRGLIWGTRGETLIIITIDCNLPN